MRTMHLYDYQDGNKTLCGRTIGGRVRWTAGYTDSGRKVRVTCGSCNRVVAAKAGK